MTRVHIRRLLELYRRMRQPSFLHVSPAYPLNTPSMIPPQGGYGGLGASLMPPYTRGSVFLPLSLTHTSAAFPLAVIPPPQIPW